MVKGTTLECCGRTYPDPHEFADHKIKEHGSESLVCCDKSFANPDEYAEHQTVTHLAA
jgi:hypothetical protein